MTNNTSYCPPPGLCWGFPWIEELMENPLTLPEVLIFHEEHPNPKIPSLVPRGKTTCQPHADQKDITEAQAPTVMVCCVCG